LISPPLGTSTSADARRTGHCCIASRKQACADPWAVLSRLVLCERPRSAD
jgi:hypothetical protein